MNTSFQIIYKMTYKVLKNEYFWNLYYFIWMILSCQAQKYQKGVDFCAVLLAFYA